MFLSLRVVSSSWYCQYLISSFSVEVGTPKFLSLIFYCGKSMIEFWEMTCHSPVSTKLQSIGAAIMLWSLGVSDQVLE